MLEELVAKAVQIGEPLEAGCADCAVLGGENVRSKAMKLFMQDLDGLDRGQMVPAGLDFGFEPGIEPAFARIEGRRISPLAPEIGFNGGQPGAMLDAGEEQRTVARAEWG